MATLRNKRKLAAVAGENQEGTPRSSYSWTSAVPEEYIIQVSGEIEDRVTENLSQEITRTKSRILGAFFKLDELLVNPHVRVQSGTVLGTARNMNVENQELTEDRSQNDPQPEVGASVYRSLQSMD